MINFLCTSPKPKVDGTDALFNEMNLLQNQFNGFATSLFPFTDPSINYPILLYGFHKFRTIQKIEQTTEVNHIFASSIFHLPIVYFLKNPIVYTVAASLREDTILPIRKFMDRIKYFIVSNEIDSQILRSKGINNIKIIQSGIDIELFNKNKLALDNKLHLLMASAPWDMNQFKTKGIFLIFEALQKIDNIHITFLWRNILPDHMLRLVKKYKVEDKITFVNEYTNVDKYLQQVHGTILLTKDGSIVKSFPHSLIESIVAGKPVILSNKIPMSNFVKNNNCGLVLEEFTSNNLISLIEQFRNRYAELANFTLNIESDIFSIRRLFDDYNDLYSKVTSTSSSKRRAPSNTPKVFKARPQNSIFLPTSRRVKKEDSSRKDNGRSENI